MDREPLLDQEQAPSPIKPWARWSFVVFGVGFAAIASLLFFFSPGDETMFRRIIGALVMNFTVGWGLGMLGLGQPRERALARSAAVANLVFALAVGYALFQL
ncbi:MAG: hypothetical protein GC205_11545 [Bacteroidetes bacterium]|nr:hypothetical protein [Bacteroidota bacterium]